MLQQRFGKVSNDQSVEGVFGTERITEWRLSGGKLLLSIAPFMAGQSTYTLRYLPR